MALVDDLHGCKVYLDTNIFVYAVEGFERHAQELAGLFAGIESGSLAAVTSELTLAECLVKPFMDKNASRQQVYLELLRDRPGLSIVPVSRAILVEAARIRSAASAVRLPDAIHLATAVSTGCNALLTNDHTLASSGIIGTRLLDARADSHE